MASARSPISNSKLATGSRISFFQSCYFSFEQTSSAAAAAAAAAAIVVVVVVVDVVVCVCPCGRTLWSGPAQFLLFDCFSSDSCSVAVAALNKRPAVFITSHFAGGLLLWPPRDLT